MQKGDGKTVTGDGLVTVFKVVDLFDNYRDRGVGDGMTVKNQNLFILKLIYIFLSTKQIPDYAGESASRRVLRGRCADLAARRRVPVMRQTRFMRRLNRYWNKAK
ncbi:MAG: hypothetical protein Q8O14_13515, partial [bacterium]|nr:hypothetical protein [bacterium]